MSVRFSSSEENMIRRFAAVQGVTVSEFIRTSVLETIEDQLDLTLAKEALAEFEKDPVVYSFDEVKKMIGI